MSTLQYDGYIGIDVSKPLLDVHFLPLGTHDQFPNHKKGFQSLIKRIQKQLGQNVLIGFEATGGYEQPLLQALGQAHLPCALLNPRQVRDFAKACGKLAKTDRVDAKIIALFLQKMQPPTSKPLDPSERLLAEQQTRRIQLINMITMEKNRLDKVSHDMRKSIERIIEALQEELEFIDDALLKTAESSPKLQDNLLRLKTFKGIGITTALGLIATLPELGTLSNKQIAALAGLAPFNRDSGARTGHRQVWGGRASVRRVLYMATVVAIRFNPQIKAFYDRLIQQGKAKMLALTACMRKMITILNTMIKHQQDWREPQVA